MALKPTLPVDPKKASAMVDATNIQLLRKFMNDVGTAIDFLSLTYVYMWKCASRLIVRYLHEGRLILVQEGDLYCTVVLDDLWTRKQGILLPAENLEDL